MRNERRHATPLRRRLFTSHVHVASGNFRPHGTEAILHAINYVESKMTLFVCKSTAIPHLENLKASGPLFWNGGFEFLLLLSLTERAIRLGNGAESPMFERCQIPKTEGMIRATSTGLPNRVSRAEMP
jgi:hypothetical protein